MTIEKPAWVKHDRAQLSDEVAAYVRELILTGALRGGEFVRLDRVAADLQISATPVREGLLALRGEGFVTLEPRRGFMVRPLSTQDIHDVFFVQAQIAGELAARATANLTDADLAELEHTQAELDAAGRAGDTAKVEERNNAFHSRVNRLAKSPKLVWFLSLALQYVPRRLSGTISGWTNASIHDHQPILAAFRARDPEAARREMERHIRHAGALLAAHLEGLAADGATS
jgi:DNA-binding GntR family transcriptional regulator